MNIPWNKLFKLTPEALWVFVGQAGTAIAGLIGIKLLTHVLDPSEFGKLALASTIVALIGTNLFGPLGQGLMRFWPISKNRGDLDVFYIVSNQYARYAIYISFLLTLILTASFGLIKGINWTTLLTLSLIVGTVTGWLSLRISVFTAARKRKQIALLNTGNAFLRPAIAAFLIILVASGASWAMVGYLLATFLILLIAERLYRRTVSETSSSTLESDKATSLSNGLGKEIFSFSWPFLVWGIFAWIHMSADRWSLQTFHGSEVVGSFAVVSQLALFPIVFSSGFLITLFRPIAFQRAEDLSQNHLIDSAKKILLAMTGFYVFGAIALIGVFAFLHQPLVLLISNERFAKFSGLLPGLTASWAFFYLGTILASFGLLINKPQRYIMPKIITSLIAVTSTFYLSFRVGPSGVVWGLGFSGVIYAFWSGMIALNIIKYERNINEIKLPAWADGWVIIRRKTFTFDKLMARIWDEKSDTIKIATIYKTPHYKFIKNYIKYGNNFKWRGSEYFRYANKYLKGEKSVLNFVSLYDSIKNQSYAEGKYKGNLCLVYRRFPIGRYRLFDGIHRLAILAALNFPTIETCIVKTKKHWFLKLIKKTIKARKM